MRVVMYHILTFLNEVFPIITVVNNENKEFRK